MTGEQNQEQVGTEFIKLLKLMDRLRSPGGCSWDRKQTHRSLLPYLIEETYEVVEAIEATAQVDYGLLAEELGDLLLHLVFQARIASEVSDRQGGFSMLEVIAALNEKLLRRHPQVFSDQQGQQEDDHQRWERIKEQEKPQRRQPFDGIPPHLPALALAQKTAARARKHGVDLALEQQPAEVKDERQLGALLFNLVVSAEQAGLDAERALRSFTRDLIQS